MKRAFMIGVAAGALLAGVNIAAAQSTMGQQPGASGGGGANTEQQKSGSGAQQQQKGQDAQKQGAQKATSGQAQQDQKGQQGQRAQDAQKQDQKGQDAQKQGDQQKAQGGQKPDQKDAQKSGDTKAGGGGKALSSEQKTKVRETVIRSSNAPRVTNVNFSVSVGTVIPRTVRFAPLPPLLVEIYPEWRSYHYVIVEERILIIEPSSFKIIAIVEV